MEPLVENIEEVDRPETECEKCGAKVLGLVFGHVAIPLKLCSTCAEAEIAEQQAAEKAKALDRALDRAGGASSVARRRRDLTLESHPDPVARAVGEDWLARYRAGERHNLWLYGPVGTRKTGLAWGIIRALALEAVDRFYALDEEYRPNAPAEGALFIVWRDLYDDLIASFDAQRRAQSTGDEADPSYLLLAARRVSVLCLDDLGAGRPPTPYALEQLEILVDRRYQAELPTIITSNLTSSRELAARLGHEDKIAGERITSRLVEGAIRHEFTGPNVRKPA